MSCVITVPTYEYLCLAIEANDWNDHTIINIFIFTTVAHRVIEVDQS